MRKQLFLLFAALLPLLASAQNKVEIDGIWYNLNSETKQAEVTKSSGAKYSRSITIPDKVFYNDIEYSVTSIGDFAFRNCGRLKVVTIPESVTSIGKKAFSYCTHLKEVNIPEESDLTSIGERAFRNCGRLKVVTIPESLTSIGYKAFSYCTHLEEINIPEESDLASIGEHAFSNCGRLTSINIPEGVTSIGDYAFWQCRNLTDITIGVTSIGTLAFTSGTMRHKEFKSYYSVDIAGSYNIQYNYDYIELHNNYYGFYMPSSGLGLNLSCEYNFSPYTGVRLTYSGDIAVVGVDYMINYSTLVAGYTSRRRWNVVFAYGLVLGKQVYGYQIGLPMQYHINKNWGISLEPRANYYYDDSFHYGGSILMGVKYSFK